jgi:hypothetical protein
MTDLQLTQVALVGARIELFRVFGFASRSAIALRRVAPILVPRTIDSNGDAGLRRCFKDNLPVWVHNIINDPLFPSREQLLMPLRRFEGELHDGRDNEVVSTVLSHGFRNENFDPLNLPEGMCLSERCAMVAHLSIWKAAYRRLEQDLSDILTDNYDCIASWCEYARQTDHVIIES